MSRGCGCVVTSLCEIAIRRGSPYSKRCGKFSHGFTCQHQPPELFLAVGAEFLGLGSRKLPGAAGFARCGEAFSAELKFGFGKGGHNRGHGSTGWRAGVYSFAYGAQQNSSLTEFCDGTGDFSDRAPRADQSL